ncbi:MAG: hypothetical protein EXQ69_06765 [Acidimicrobiia bacterium]|nr:hypothetical protein [Acidimicrobiia bacterium]
MSSPVVDVRITCFDGNHQPIDSSEMAFKTAATHSHCDPVPSHVTEQFARAGTG